LAVTVAALAGQAVFPAVVAPGVPDDKERSRSRPVLKMIDLFYLFAMLGIYALLIIGLSILADMLTGK
jgi:hypothetical protein